MQSFDSQNTRLFDLKTDDIGESLAALRLVNPREQRCIDESIKIYGQIAPIVVRDSSSAPYEIIDGFKRLRAARNLELTTLRACTLSVGKHAVKAAVINLNKASGRVTELEEAFAISSLAREDGLTHKEIATLFGRHRSWVSRRIALVDRLCDEAREEIRACVIVAETQPEIRLGLLSPAKAREISKVPRGTQPDLLKSLQNFNLTSRETARLVTHLLATSRSSWQEILKFPDQIIDDQPTKCVTQKPLEEVLARFVSHCRSITKAVKDTKEVPCETAETCRYAASVISRTASELRRLTRQGEGSSDA